MNNAVNGRGLSHGAVLERVPLDELRVSTQLELELASSVVQPPAGPCLAPLPSPPLDVDGIYFGAFRVFMEVRPTEVDQFGVVNNTCYAAYLLHARHKLMEAIGFLIDGDTVIATKKITLNFCYPLRPGDRFYAQTAWCKAGRSSAVMEDRIVLLPRKAGDKARVVVEGEAQVIMLDRNYRPARIPEGLHAAGSVLMRDYLANREALLQL